MIRLAITAAYVAIALVFMLVGRVVSNVLFRSKRTTSPPNLALSVRHGGLYPDYQLRLFRRGAGRFVEDAVHESVRVTGRVPDVRPYLARASACVVPLRIARGIQNKLLEAMAMALPTVRSLTIGIISRRCSENRR